MNRILNKKVTGIKKALVSLMAVVMTVSSFPAYAMAGDTATVSLPETTQIQGDDVGNAANQPEVPSSSAAEGVSRGDANGAARSTIHTPSALSQTPSAGESMTAPGVGRSNNAPSALLQDQAKTDAEKLTKADYVLTLGVGKRQDEDEANKTVASGVRAGSDLVALPTGKTSVASDMLSAPVYTVYVQKDATLKLALAPNTSGSLQWTVSPTPALGPFNNLDAGHVTSADGRAVLLNTSALGKNYYVAQDLTSWPMRSTAVIEVVVVNPTLNLASQPDSADGYFANQPISLTTSVGGFPVGSTPTYTWYHNDKKIEGQVESTLAFTLGKTGAPGNFHCVATLVVPNVGTLHATSNTVNIVEKVAPFSFTLSGDMSVVEGSSTTITARHAIPGGASFTYTWTDPAGDKIDGSTSYVLGIPLVKATDAGTYTCVATRTIGENTQSYTQTHRLTVQAPLFEVKIVPDFVPDPSFGSTVYWPGQKLSLSATFTEQPNETYTYQWSKAGIPLVGKTSKTLLFEELKPERSGDTGLYACKVSNSKGRAATGSFLISVAGTALPTATISNAYGNTAILAGFDTTLTSHANDFGTNSGFAYQWYKDGAVMENQNGKTLKIASMTEKKAGTYKVEITGLYYGQEKTVSKEIKLTCAPMNVTKLNTTDTSNLIDIKAFNYDQKINSIPRSLQFVNTAQSIDGNAVNPSPPTFSDTQGNKGAYQGVVEPKIGTDGYPVLAKISASGSSQDRMSTEYLFGTTSASNLSGGRTTYNNANFLLKKDGNMYSYDSEKNHAVLNTKTNNFDVWNFMLAPTRSPAPTAGGFFPFNKQMANQDGSLIVAPYRDSDFWFGTTMDFNFAQPVSGQLDNSDMVFEFTGDDDVWVFIDDMLFLDLGGIHGKVAGNINFAKGTVYVNKVIKGTVEENNKLNSVVTFEQLLQQAGVNDLGKYLVQGANGKYTTLKNGTEHNLKFYYMERGGGESNCSIKFNLPPVPRNNVTVKKAVNNLNENLEADTDFGFQIKNEGNAYASQEFTLIKSGGATSKGTTDANGMFTLKRDESARFADLISAEKVEVIETNVSASDYSKVTITGAGDVKTFTAASGTTDITGITTGEHLASDLEGKTILFTNHRIAANLVIEKALVEGQTSTDQFLFDVTLGGVAYAGNPVRMQVGQKITLEGIPADTGYTVTERNPNTVENTYLAPTAAVSGADGNLGEAAALVADARGNYQVKGTTFAGVSTLVKFTNQLENKKATYNTVTVNKTIDTMAAIQGDPIFFFKLENDTTGDVYYRQVRFAQADETLTVLFENLPHGTYTLSEEQPMRFEYSGMSVSATDATATDTQKGTASITFEEFVAGSATVNYHNAKAKGYYFTDTDVVANKIQIQK